MRILELSRVCNEKIVNFSFVFFLYKGHRNAAANVSGLPEVNAGMFAATVASPPTKMKVSMRMELSGGRGGGNEQNMKFHFLLFLYNGHRNAAANVSGLPKVNADMFAATIASPPTQNYSFHENPGIARGV